MTPEKKLEQKGITLPEVPTPVANYAPVKKSGKYLYISGQSCVVNGEIKYRGRLGKDLTIEEGYDAARLTAVNIIAVLKDTIGSLDKIKNIVKVFGLVSSDQDFFDQPKVINGASDLFVEIFGEKGLHARSAVGTSVLPFNIPVEIEIIAEVE